jgi:hypothetical protein
MLQFTRAAICFFHFVPPDRVTFSGLRQRERLCAFPKCGSQAWDDEQMTLALIKETLKKRLLFNVLVDVTDDFTVLPILDGKSFGRFHLLSSDGKNFVRSASRSDAENLLAFTKLGRAILVVPRAQPGICYLVINSCKRRVSSAFILQGPSASRETHASRVIIIALMMMRSISGARSCAD